MMAYVGDAEILRKPRVFSESNHMNPGPSIQELARTHGMKVPEPLSQVEEMMISPVYLLVFYIC